MTGATRAFLCAILVLSLLLGVAPASGSPDAPTQGPAAKPVQIRLQRLAFDPLAEAPRLPEAVASAGLDRAVPGSRYHILQLRGPVRESDKRAVERAGAELLDYLPDYAFVARIEPSRVEEVRRLAEVRWVGPFLPAYRVSPSLDPLFQAGGDAVVQVRVFPGEDASALADGFAAQGATVLARAAPLGKRSGYVRLKVSGSQVALLARAEGVAWVERYVEPHLVETVAAPPRNNTSADVLGVNQVRASHGYFGAGQIVGIADTGLDTGYDSTMAGAGAATTSASVAAPTDPTAGSVTAQAGPGRARRLVALKRPLAVSEGSSGAQPQAGSPDLTVPDITTTTSPLVAGSPYHLVFQVANVGSGHATASFYIDLYVAGSFVDRWVCDGLPAGWYAQGEGDYTQSASGDWQVAVVADSTGVVSESDETNNRREETWSWGAPQPVADMHPDLRGRIQAAHALGRPGDWSDGVIYAGQPKGGHGTHVAGSVLGNGAQSGAAPATHQYAGSFAGGAPEARVVFQSVMDSFGGLNGIGDVNDLLQQAYNDGARIHTNSWGADVYGQYTLDARSADAFVWDHPDVLVLFAAGNAGTDANGDGIVDAGSIGSPATGKNVVAVGASEGDHPNPVGGAAYRWGDYWPSDFPVAPINADYLSDDPGGMAAFSSRGPTLDSRVKPDVVAPGTNIISTRARVAGATALWGAYGDGEWYSYCGGTSMATPLVAGASALLREHVTKTLHVPDPSAALLRAMLVAGTSDLSPGQYGTGQYREIPAARPNHVTGWGRVDVAESIQPTAGDLWLEDQGAGLNTGGQVDYYFQVAAGGVLRVALAWTDYPGTEYAAHTLVNDLDLTVTNPSGTVFYPNGGASADTRNNVETVYLGSAPGGAYKVSVRGANVPFGPQPYALVVVGSGLARIVPPSAPAQRSPADGATLAEGAEVALCWEAVPGAAEYYAEYWGGPDGTQASGWIGGQCWSLGASLPAGAYSWRVKARNQAGESGWSATRSFTVARTCHLLTLGHTGEGGDPIATPANSTGCAAGRYVAGESISLTASPAPGHRVAGWTGTDDDSSAATTNGLSMPAADHAVTVEYVAVEPPDPPTDLRAVATSPSEIGLDWQNVAADASDVHVERSADGSSGWVEVGTATGASYADSGLDCGARYYYRVRAHRHSDGAYSAYSATASDVTRACPDDGPPLPPAPAVISPADGATVDTTTPVLEWSAIPASYGVDYYEIEILDDAAAAVDQARVVGSTYSVPAGRLVRGARYTWHVRAHNARGLGESSSATFQVAPSEPPQHTVYLPLATR